MSDVVVTIEQIRQAITGLRKVTVEVVPGFWIAPERIGPNGTVKLEKREWEKLQELCQILAVPANTGQPRASGAGNAEDSQS